MRRWERPMVRDAGLALLLVGSSLLLGANPFAPRAVDEKLMVLLGSPQAWRLQLLWWWAAALPALVALPLRRRWQLLAFGLAAGSGLVHLLNPVLPLLPVDLAAAVTLSTVASRARTRRTGVLALMIALLALYPVCLLASAGRPAMGIGPRLDVLTTHLDAASLLAALSTATVPVLLLGIAWAIGDNLRTRRHYEAALEERAVAAERARLSRELHDVVAHGMSVMVVQAQAAAAALPPGSDESALALTHIVDTGRASLAELRQVVGAMRQNTGPELAAPPGFGTIAALVDQVRDAGTPVELHIEGEPVPLPAGVDLSAYRVIQEALTNVRKHAGPQARATVRLVFRANHIEIDVADDGPGAAPARGGHGLRGIVERVSALGGAAEIGPRPGGGFGVHALLPTRATT